MELTVIINFHHQKAHKGTPRDKVLTNSPFLKEQNIQDKVKVKPILVYNLSFLGFDKVVYKSASKSHLYKDNTKS